MTPYLYYHTASVLENKLYLYGGYFAEEESVNSKKVNGEIFEVQPYSLICKIVAVGNYIKPKARRNHICIAVNRVGALLVHGGLDKRGKILGDFWMFYPGKKIIFNLISGKKLWVSKSIKETVGVKRLLISHHCAAYIPDLKEFGSFQKSMLMFGGCYEEGELNNDLWMVSGFTNLRPSKLEITKVRTRGQKPEKRYLFCMSVLSKSRLFFELNFLVESLAISGGMGEGGNFFDDLYIFVCVTKTWINVRIQFGLVERAGHSVNYF